VAHRSLYNSIGIVLNMYYENKGPKQKGNFLVWSNGLYLDEYSKQWEYIDILLIKI